MMRRTLAILGLLLLGSVTFAADPTLKPWKPGTPSPAAPAGTQETLRWHGKPVSFVDGVPDTGQFLPDSAVLGSVDERRFSVWEFRQYWYASYAQDRPESDSAGRFQFLNAMADKEVLARLARAIDRPFDFADRAQMREHTQRVLSNMTYRRLVADSVEVTEEEVRHAYQQNLVALHLRRIVTADFATAEKARAEVAGGKLTWPAAVARYSVATQDSGPAGDIGWVQRSALDPTAAIEVFDLADGQLSKVFVDKVGFEFLQVDGRRPNPALSLEQLRRMLVDELKPLKISRRVDQVRGRLRQRIGMSYDTANIVFAANLFGKSGGLKYGEDGQPVLNVTAAVPRLAARDTGRVLARWSEGQFTLGRFLAAYRSLPPIQRQNVGSFESFRWFLDGNVLEPYMAQLGIERGVDRDPLTIAYLDKKREEIRVDHLFQDSVQAKVSVTPEERRQYYKSRLPDFWSFHSVRYAAIVRGSKAGADSLAERLRRGEPAREILRADSLRLGKSDGSIRADREDKPGPYFNILSQDMKTGEVIIEGPDQQGDYLVIQKLEHDPGHQLSYEEVEKIVDESVQNIKAEKLLKELIARHRAKHAIVLHPELLMRVKLTDPMAE